MKRIIKCIIYLLIIIIFILFFLYLYLNLNKNKDKLILDKCIDGDTASFILNNKKVKVRFLAIDTPESTHPNRKQEEYGVEASNYTCTLLKNAKNIYIEYDSNSDRYDKYNRLLGWIFIDNININEKLVKEGYARVRYIYGDYKYLDTLCNQELIANSNNLNIWSKNNYNYSYCKQYK